MPKKKTKPNNTVEIECPVRTGRRVKKLKVVFDPSENNAPKRRQQPRRDSSVMAIDKKSGGETQPKITKRKSRSTDKHETQANGKIPLTLPETSGHDFCVYCGRVDYRKGRKFISCRDCCDKVHLTCVKENFQNENLLQDQWRCDNCTTCVVCYETSKASPLVICCVCVEAYHFNCHTPKLGKSVNKLRWECWKCQNINESVANNKIPIDVKCEFGLEPHIEIKENPIKIEFEEPKIVPKIEHISDAEIENNSEITIPTYIKPEIDEDDVVRPSIAINMDEINGMPQISEWTCDDVFQFIVKYFPREAYIFQEQEIDGASLLLLKRSDVIRGFGFKLGPALRLYNVVTQLQTRCNDTNLTWM